MGPCCSNAADKWIKTYQTCWFHRLIQSHPSMFGWFQVLNIAKMKLCLVYKLYLKLFCSILYFQLHSITGCFSVCYGLLCPHFVLDCSVFAQCNRRVWKCSYIQLSFATSVSRWLCSPLSVQISWKGTHGFFSSSPNHNSLTRVWNEPRSLCSLTSLKLF